MENAYSSNNPGECYEKNNSLSEQLAAAAAADTLGDGDGSGSGVRGNRGGRGGDEAGTKITELVKLRASD